MVSGLRSGEIDGFISTKNYDEIMRDFYYFNIPTISKDNNHIGIHKDYPELFNIISKEVDYLIKTGWSKAIKEAINFELEKQNIIYDEEEKRYLEEKPSVTVGLLEGHIPYGYEKNYRKLGIIPNILDRINFFTDIKFNYVFDSYENLLKNDNVELIATVGNVDKYYIYSNHMFSHTLSAVGRRRMPFIKELYDLEPYRIGTITYSPENDYILKKMPHIDLKKYDNFTNVFHSLETNKIDYALVPKIIADRYISEFDGLAYKGMFNESFHYIMAKSERERILINIINKNLAVMDMDSIIYEEVNRFADFNTDNKVNLIIIIAVISILIGISINLYIKKRQTELKLMYTDTSTGINNKLWLEKKLKKNIEIYSFFQLKLKDFDILQERYGQDLYNKALKRAVKTIEENLSKNDLLAIIDKEGFVIAKPYISEPKMEEFANNLSKLFGERILIHDMSYSLEAYVGYLTVEDDIKDFNSIIDCLYIAVYFSEKENKVTSYSYDIFSKYQDKIDFDKQVVSAVMNEKLDIFYRNIYDKKGDTFALDTSVKCYLDDYGILNSKGFYEAIKKLELENQVDRITLKNTVMQMKSWEKEGKAVRVLVDISDKTISRSDFVPWLMDLIKGFKSSVLIIKLNNSTLYSYAEKLLFIDDKHIEFLMMEFGDEIYSLVEFMEFPAEIVCIGDDFILNIGENKLYEDILDYVVATGKKLGKKVMILDIVLKNQHDMIKKKDIDFVGGNYLQRFVCSKEVTFENINNRR